MDIGKHGVEDRCGRRKGALLYLPRQLGLASLQLLKLLPKACRAQPISDRVDQFRFILDSTFQLIGSLSDKVGLFVCA